MEKVDVSVCIRPYVHDVVEKVKRKPKFKSGKHYIRYKKEEHELHRTSGGYVIWVNEDDW